MSMKLKSLAATLLAFFINSTTAAEFFATTVNLGAGSVGAIKIEGEIIAGDAELFSSIIKNKPNELRRSLYLTLNSPGGNLVEAIKLARLLRKIGFVTVVEKDALCVSACFILYVAGYSRMGQLSDVPFSRREMASIGVHRAFIEPNIMRTLPPEEARNVVRQNVRLATMALKEFDVPDEIIALVEKTPAAMVSFLNSAQLNTLNTVPWFTDLAHARCGLKVPLENAGFQKVMAYTQRLVECELDIIVEHHKKLFPLDLTE